MYDATRTQRSSNAYKNLLLQYHYAKYELFFQIDSLFVDKKFQKQQLTQNDLSLKITKYMLKNHQINIIQYLETEVT